MEKNLNNLRKRYHSKGAWTAPKEKIHIRKHQVLVVTKKEPLRNALKTLVVYTLSMSNNNRKRNNVKNSLSNYYKKKYFTGTINLIYKNAYGRRMVVPYRFPKE